MDNLKPAWIAAVVAACLALACAFNLSQVKQDVMDTSAKLDSAKQELQEIKQQLEEANRSSDQKSQNRKLTESIFETLRESFGYASDAYYADSRIVLLEAGGEPEKFVVHFNKSGGAIFNMLSKDTKDSNFKVKLSRDVTGKWSSKFHNNEADFEVTPGKTRGYNIIHFSNDVDSDSFDVLVFVI